MYAYNTVQELVTLRNDADNCVISSSFSTRPPKLGRLAEVVAGTWGSTDISFPIRCGLAFHANGHEVLLPRHLLDERRHRKYLTGHPPPLRTGSELRRCDSGPRPKANFPAGCRDAGNSADNCASCRPLHAQ